MTTPARQGPRHLSYPGLIAVVVGYLTIIKGVGYAAASIWDLDGEIYTARDVVVLMWLPLGLALAYTYAVITWLGWLRPVWHDDRPVRRWVWAVPVVFVACIALAIDYGDLAAKPLGYVLALLVATQIVGWGEEGMFRGIGVVSLRFHELSEGKVALWSSVLFGAVHLTNALGPGSVSKALPQAVAVSFAGYFFYLIRRVSRGNAVNSVVHGLFDFSVISGTAIAAGQGSYLGSGAAILAYVVTGALLVIRRKHIETARSTSALSTPESP
ncbi:hypothetical protein GCM10011519_27890 [Marmoricola endophyticus]|uniref:CAAX prenyl protease 2/Lysostaphin resistance protein A-like domain-containing protein n=1 Tax=Marmoricola endophyticus TaxID=2040280 RepID=A0A917F825_9ACTN|nr:CPBP family intramembrane glutamic endopeptidase [Marmoricola endophyticus]GGF52339.1 hypothetical protein GCM10011519_27890 [Marmoricola endophyticus]